MEILAKNTKKNKKIAKIILNKLKKKNTNLLLLQGNLGAGKTTITRSIAKELKTQDNVQSPTFIIQRIYKCKKNPYNFKKIYHIDLYRLTNYNQVIDIGIFENLNNKQNLFIVEWPNIIEKKLNQSKYIKVKIDILNDNKRKFTLM